MTEGADTFLARRESRLASKRLTQLLVLGYGIGLIALVLGMCKYFFVAGASSALWGAVAWFGGAALLVTAIVPFIWQWPEKVIHRFGNWLGHGVMTALLVLVYFLFFWPVGALIRVVKGSRPIYEWGATPASGMQGWQTKELPRDVATAERAVRGGKRRVGFLGVLVFFVRRRLYFLIPVLVVLVSLGIALFFLQTSALAPFIYTLF